jgi:apolipoprotein N-acyltransferase
MGPEKLAPIIMLVLLVSTSFDKTAAMLGRRYWRWLHWTGSHFFWISFLVAYGKRAEGSLFYSSLTAFVLSAFVVRMTAFALMTLRRRNLPA